MPIVGKSFSIDTGKLDNVLSKIKNENVKARLIVLKRMTAATDLIYRTARAKRPMISKAQAKAEGRKSRVSDPGAQAGVPIRTGALQLSIQKDVRVTGSKITGKVFTDSPYGAYVEWGTSRMAARPFMRPALALNRAAIKLIFNKKENA